MGSSRQKANHRTVLLSGGVGGARMARGLAAVLTPGKLTVVVNIGDDDLMYGVHVSPDLDTVVYTLAGAEGPHGWGLDGDSFIVMDRLAELGVDTTFRLGDRDLATCLERTNALGRGECLSAFTFGVDVGPRSRVRRAACERRSRADQSADRRVAPGSTSRTIS